MSASINSGQAPNSNWLRPMWNHAPIEPGSGKTATVRPPDQGNAPLVGDVTGLGTGGGVGIGRNSDSAFGELRLRCGLNPAASGSLTLAWPVAPPAAANGLVFTADWATLAPAVQALAGPTIDLNFMVPGTLPPGMTFTRASVGNYIDALGVMQSAAINVPRWNYEGGALRGMLVETQRTNLLLNSAVLVTQSVTVTAQNYTLSFYGSGSVTLTGAAAGTLNGTGPFPQRVSMPVTPTAGTLTLTVAGSVIDANLEAGTYPTSWITTTAAAQTRSGDVARLIDAVALGGTTDRTIAIDAWMPNISPPGVGLALGSVDDATNANIMLLISPGTAAAVRAQIIAAGTQTVFGGDVASGARPNLVRAALANGAVWYGAVNGIVMSNPSAVSGTPSVQLGPLTTLHCGTNQLNTGQVDGSMQRVRYWPRLLSPTEVVTQTGGPTGLVMVLPWTANRPLIPGDVVRIPYRWNTSN